jgi:hypothetical protein
MIRSENTYPYTRNLQANLSVLLMVFVIGLTGCEQAVVAESPLTFQFAKKLKGIIESKELRPLDDLAFEIEEAVKTKKISTKEADLLISAIVDAEAKDWEIAAKAVDDLIEASHK